MAEYMDYDDSLYDTAEHTKRQKIRSWISIIVSAAILISIVVLVIVRSPENIRANFDTITGEKHTVGVSDAKSSINQNEFYIIKQSFDDDKTIRVNKEFEKKYPQTYQVISQSLKKIAKNKVFGFDDGNCVTVAQAYVVSQTQNVDSTKSDSGVDGVIGADIAIVPYSSSADGKIIVNAPIRFSLRFYNENKGGVKYIASQYVKTDNFRVNFSDVSIKLKSKNGEKIKLVDTILNFTDAISKNEADKSLLYKSLTLDSGNEEKYSLISGGQRSDFSLEKRLVANEPNDTASIKIDFNDTIYRKFKYLEVKAEKNDIFTICIN